MSNLNKAFIQAYKKTSRSAGSGGPHFPLEAQATVAPSAPAPKAHPPIPVSPVPVSPAQIPPAPLSTAPLSHGASAPKREETIAREQASSKQAPVYQPVNNFYRVDSPEAVDAMQPWFTSVSTIGVDAFTFQVPASEPFPTSTPSPVAPPKPAIIPESPTAPSVNRVVTPEKPKEEANLRDAIQHRMDPPHSPFASAIPFESHTKRQSLSAYLKLARGMGEVETVEDTSAQTPASRSKLQSNEVVEEIDPATEANAFAHRAQVETQFHPVWEVDSFQWPAVIQRLAQHEPSVFAEVGRHLKQACRTGLKVLAVTSSSAGQGRSTVACSMARSAARVGLKVALVDGDLHHPALADDLNLETVHGWDEVVSTGVPLEEAAIHSLEDRITLIPMGARAGNAPVAPDHPKVQGILRRLAASFDIVIIDSQHLAHPAARIMGCGVGTPIDAAVLVVDMNFPDEQMTLESIRRLNRCGIESVGIVENF